eukprot:TRINITY_DN17268_c0_g1_i1.p1 TRINITY_DN17268_c0_g1~~TRINITY_DN17268_c0_g1_i1.p1  ORF type:complete len:432 (+),score=86.25 TRINITY_DN17268_c0_g1_i1:208-1503(+)
MLRLHCVAQNYAWGRLGEESEVAKLHSSGTGAIVTAATPYAELWMGTHPSGPSLVSFASDEGGAGENKLLLSDWLHQHPQALGSATLSKWHGELPFLFKILSVNTALSIQAHPDKKLAEALHSERPNVYKDDNHKPEMALALTEFETLCSFVTTEELKSNLESVPELAEVVGDAGVEAFLSAKDPKEGLKAAFTALMTSDKAAVEAALTKLVSRLSKIPDPSSTEKLILRLNEQYPGDVGVFCPYFLNYITLSPGESIYLAANEPHAYLSGECVECMATSDNVVRAGLTPKLRDTGVLCSMLTYNQGKPEILKGQPIDSHTRRYIPPFEEFEIDSIEVPKGTSYKLPFIPGPSIVLVQSGVGLATQGQGNAQRAFGVKKGDVFFLPAETPLELSASIEAAPSNGHADAPLKVFRAGVNDKVFSPPCIEENS